MITTVSSPPESQGGSPASPEISDRRVRVARLARDDWTPPKGERQRRRRGEEQGEREGTHSSSLGPSFTDRERPRTSGAPTNLPSIGCPTPSRAVTRRILPAFARRSTASHPRRYTSLPLSRRPPTSSRYHHTVMMMTGAKRRSSATAEQLLPLLPFLGRCRTHSSTDWRTAHTSLHVAAKMPLHARVNGWSRGGSFAKNV